MSTQGNQGNPDDGKGLTAKEIFDKIIKGEVVNLPNDPVLARQLLTHLQVIKSREKKLFASLGLDFTSSIVSVDPVYYYPADQKFDPNGQLSIITHFEVKLIAPKKRRTYPAFTIQNEHKEPSIN